MIRLLLKTYNNNKKYLCKSESNNYTKYRGSGDNITDDLIVIDTEVLLETEDKALFKEVGIYYSKLWNVVDNPLFLNKKYEEGDGGDTVSGKFWITNGNKDKYIDKDLEIPSGWRKGRSTGAFVNSSKQKDFSSRSNHNTEKQIAASRKNGLANKGNKYFLGKKHSEETKQHLSLVASNRKRKQCPYCEKETTPGMFARWHGDRCKNK